MRVCYYVSTTLINLYTPLQGVATYSLRSTDLDNNVHTHDPSKFDDEIRESKNELGNTITSLSTLADDIEKIKNRLQALTKQLSSNVSNDKNINKDN